MASQNIQRKPADVELPTKEQKTLVIKIIARKEALAERIDMITTLRSVPKRKVIEEGDTIKRSWSIYR